MIQIIHLTFRLAVAIFIQLFYIFLRPQTVNNILNFKL